MKHGPSFAPEAEVVGVEKAAFGTTSDALFPIVRKNNCDRVETGSVLQVGNEIRLEQNMAVLQANVSQLFKRLRVWEYRRDYADIVTDNQIVYRLKRTGVRRMMQKGGRRAEKRGFTLNSSYI